MVGAFGVSDFNGDFQDDFWKLVVLKSAGVGKSLIISPISIIESAATEFSSGADNDNALF